jgi:NAD(P)H-hydrate epimerase
MIPIVTPAEMGAIDAAAPEPVEVLIGRAGAAVARSAIGMLGGTYGRRVVILEGKGNNGNDGREAARRLRARGVRVIEIDVAARPEGPPIVPPCDLVIDAAYGTGFRGTFDPPEVPEGSPVLAVDIPSGVDGLTGAMSDEPGSRVLRARRTVTFAALKPGLLLHPGAAECGRIEVADIGLDASSAPAHLVTAADVVGWLPERGADTHKWRSAVWVVAGSLGMGGAAALACGGAQRAGAGYVRVSTPGGGGPSAGQIGTEVVHVDLHQQGWAAQVLDGLDRFRALLVGNGMGTTDETARQIRALVHGSTIPTVVDADGLTALGVAATGLTPSTVLTPHDGEYERLAGEPPGPDRLAATRSLAERTGAVVLLKGPATVVAHPDGRVLVTTTGDARLATAGTGDVLAGVIAALCARGIEPFEAAAAGGFLHGLAADLGWREGLVAGDVVALLPAAIEHLVRLDPRFPLEPRLAEPT